MDAVVARITGYGGRVLREAANSVHGRWALVADPSGAPFAIIAR